MKKIFTLMLLFVTIFSFAINTKVARIIDGDTFETETGEKVRLIGINAPELSDIFGNEAKVYLSSLIENKLVDLQTDNSCNDRYIYQRLLRYVVLDGVDINEKMVADGFAFAYLKYKFSKSIKYEQSQISASESNNGIWGNGKDEVNIEKKTNTKLKNIFSPKAYFVGFLTFALLMIGIFSYIRK
jgi:micrococcal nuclease